MKKSVLLFGILVLSLVIILPLVLAANGDDDNDADTDTGTSEEDNVDKAYSCLKSKLGTNCAGSNSIEQLSFNNSISILPWRSGT